MLSWTDDDLDTLTARGAARSAGLCTEGGVGDGYLVSILDDEFLAEVAHANGMTVQDIRDIQERYRRGGASDKVIRQEVEAFIVARGIDASVLATALDKHCSL